MLVLLVEQDRGWSEKLREYLESKGFEVLEAWTVNQGFDIAREEQPDVVVTCTFMLGESGIELARQIKQDRAGQAIVAMSTTMDDQLREQYRKVGVTETWDTGDGEVEHLVEAINAAYANRPKK